MKPKVIFAKNSQDYFPLGGGLDLVSPAIAKKPGTVIDSQNYEPSINGGYRRIDGYERFDGRASPTGSDYWTLPVALSGSPSVGSTIVGATSTATAAILAVFDGYLVLAGLTGNFSVGEQINVSAVSIGLVAGAQALSGASSVSDHADYLLLAANYQRQFILKVPGSGPIRGVWVFDDVTYAFRDNVGATAGGMWKATGAGWVQVQFQTELPFSAAVGQINVGGTVTGGTSGATGIVIGALLRTGTWTVTGVGSLVLSGVTGDFVSGEPIQVSTVTKATSAGVSTPIARSPGGKMEFFNENFSATEGGNRMYGVDGVNPAFQFDGVNYFPIRTGMVPETPEHVIAHKGSLWLSFYASVQYSGIAQPFAWTVVLGAGEISVSSKVSGFLPQPATSTSGASLAVFTAKRTFMVYGSSSADYALVPSVFDLGFAPFTAQQVGNDAWGLTSRGIQALGTTLNYGNFEYASISHLIQPLIARQLGKESASNSIRAKNQYRVYFTDNLILSVGLTGAKPSGIMVLDYGRQVRCICTTNLSSGQEVTYFGSDDGYVYHDNIGTSFDGQPIEAWCRLAFNNVKSPQVTKRMRRAILECATDAYSEIKFSYDLNYADPGTQPSAIMPDTRMAGFGGYWDQFAWDNFTWDAAYVSSPSVTLDGTATNISMLFYSNRAQDQPHELSGFTLISSPRRLKR